MYNITNYYLTCFLCLWQCMTQYLTIMITESSVSLITCPDAQCPKQGKMDALEVSAKVPRFPEIYFDKLLIQAQHLSNILKLQVAFCIQFITNEQVKHERGRHMRGWWDFVVIGNWREFSFIVPYNNIYLKIEGKPIRVWSRQSNRWNRSRQSNRSLSRSNYTLVVSK